MDSVTAVYYAFGDNFTLDASSPISELAGKAFWCNQLLPYQLYPSDGHRHSPTQSPLPGSIWTVSSLVMSTFPVLHHIYHHLQYEYCK